MYRYIALLRGRHTRATDDGSDIDHALREVGLQQKVALGHIELYASDDTPVLSLSPGSALIGHVFSRDGHSPIDSAKLASASSRGELAKHVIDELWGEYLLLHAPKDDPDATTVMRDPSGGVDCIYSLRGGFIASDISIATHARLHTKEIDWDFIRSNLIYPYLKTGRTGLIGLRELLPGYQLNIRGDGATIDEMWTPWDFVAPQQRYRDRREAQADVRRAVASTVNRWAETDKSLLLELSGGLDSSIVAACLQDAHARVACCNLVTPVPGADERRYAMLMADVLRAELHIETLGFENVHFNFPPPHAVAPSTWFLQHASNELKETIGRRLGVNSFFSGGGGDTVFCYTRTAAPAADAFRERGMIAGITAISDLAELHQCTVWKAGRLALKKLLAPPRPPRKADRSFLAATPAQDMLEAHPWFAAPDGSLPGDRERIFDLAGTQVFRDGLARGAKWHLRMPLLSQPVVEACLKVPSWMWIAEGRNRAVARDAFADVLPPDILHRRSKGTFMNYSGAAYRQNKSVLQEYLLSGQLEGQGLLDTDSLRRFFDRDLATRDDRFMRIFDLCAVENWIRHQA
ncbi:MULTISPECIES: lasso peptide isopeptide bond-forming cyclase [unclassified Rhodanobacter]|uniref:lasso peptide isopeptide bond-forming cyclase n=1 Tax=unclassified Rhodanobacter TaxID=2621553 RepID=UPI0007A9957F|nr:MULTISPECIES: lasso peptide isopeptide bond-forming cyclase [unclassified Rhodanobacter]KZC17968.1 asparagine synthase [Rhodanobacter sp. FW104-R8]KZC25570.1 asparagine synthase [Rhodanobacter sp. FW510-T8]KZC32774.1 asparagine synthase [Rhodanobacter sp. FW510-R10]